MRFTVISEVDVITIKGGTYRQMPMYKREEDKTVFVYAKHGSGYVRLYKNGSTSNPDVRWDETDLTHKFNSTGRMTL